MDKETLTKAALILARAKSNLAFNDFKKMYDERMAEHYWTTQYSQRFDIIRFLKYLDPPDREKMITYILKREEEEWND